MPIPRLINLEDYLDYVSNRVMPDTRCAGAGEAVERLGVHGHRDHAAAWRSLPTQLECAACGIDLPQARQGPRPARHS